MYLITFVALLAEGVDRNGIFASRTGLCVPVALLAEGVDRNLVINDFSETKNGRPPRGGRG